MNLAVSNMTFFASDFDSAINYSFKIFCDELPFYVRLILSRDHKMTVRKLFNDAD